MNLVTKWIFRTPVHSSLCTSQYNGALLILILCSY